MRKFVRQERGSSFAALVVDDRSLGHAIVAGLMMFEPKRRDVIAEREDEMIVIPMTRAVQPPEENALGEDHATA